MTDKPISDRIRDAAWALDQLDRICKALYEPVARGHTINAGEVTVTVDLTEGGRPITGDTALKLMAWVGGDYMQRDLRGIADALDAMDAPEVPLPEVSP